MNSYSSMHIQHQSDVLRLPLSFDSTTFCIMATGLLTGSSILLLFSLPPKNSPNSFCRLCRFLLCPSLIPLPCSCDFAVTDMMEACDKACTSVEWLGSVLSELLCVTPLRERAGGTPIHQLHGHE